MNKCLIGACLIEFSLGFFVIWGKVNIYFYSYFKHFQPDLPYNYNFIIGSIIAIPMVLSSLVSLKLASYFGYKKFLVFMGFA